MNHNREKEERIVLKLDHLEDAIDKVSSLKQFCFGVRIVSDDDGSVLFSSLPETSEAATSPAQPAQKKRASGVAQASRTGKYGFSRKQAAQEVSRVQILIGEQCCTLEMIQPHRRVISDVTGTPIQSFDGKAYLTGAINGMLQKDTLTGLYNRRFVKEQLPASISDAFENGQPLSLIFVDVDHFQSVNDQYGSIAGDLVLQHIAELLKKSVGRSDSWAARYGADEFMICLPGVNNAAAYRVVNRMRVAVMNERFRLESGSICLTCCFVVRTVEQNDLYLPTQTLLAWADETIARIKQTGGNIIY